MTFINNINDQISLCRIMFTLGNHSGKSCAKMNHVTWDFGKLQDYLIDLIGVNLQCLRIKSRRLLS